MLLLSLGASLNARAEIPHENYDLVRANLDVVIGILNSTIAYSENALDSMYYERMDYVEQNLSIVRGLLGPAEQLLVKIKDVAASYENLSRLLPPFANLSSEEDSFSSMEVSLLSARDDIVSASRLANLTDEEMRQALDAINRVNSLMWQMNRTIDDMLVSANEIIALEIDGRRPFAENNLIPLIERLRDLLYTILVEIELLIQDGIPWSRNVPFFLLWLDSTHYYLGEQIRGGGYLFFNGSFAASHEVQLLMDGDNWTAATTGSDGKYSFTYQIPLNVSWLGSHVIQATADTINGTLLSDEITIQISLIPTVIILEPSASLLTHEDQLTMYVRLFDARSRAVPNAPCNLTVDGSDDPFETDSTGTHHQSWDASELGYGTHEFQASFDGLIPHAPCASNIVTVVIDIPTRVTVSLVQTRVFIQYQIIGNGTLYSNGTTPLPGEEVTVSFDGVEVINVTTDESGSFVFTYPASSIGPGGHTLKVAFSHRESIWRYSQVELGFSVYAQKKTAYPFFPHIPGWGGFGPPETFPELFIGDYAYYTWLLILVTLAIAIRILQVRKSRREVTGRIQGISLEPLDRGSVPVAPEEPSAASDFAFELSKDIEAPVAPNDRVVWYYQSLLTFLRRKRNIAIEPSMTHWELAKLLRSLGYPIEHVERITILFEQAFYSGIDLTESDTVAMSMSLGNLVRTREWGVSHAV